MKKLIIFLYLISGCCFADNTWHCVSRTITCHTWRMEVPGGWLVSGDNADSYYAMTFFPDRNHEWSI